MRTAKLRLLLLVLVLLASLVATAAGANGSEGEEQEDAVDWLSVMYLVAFAVAVSVVAFKDSKRTHLN